VLLRKFLENLKFKFFRKARQALTASAEESDESMDPVEHKKKHSTRAAKAERYFAFWFF